MVQETWIRAVETLDRFSWRSSFPTWLHGIAFNVVREERRRRLGRPDSLGHDDISAGEITNSAAVSPNSRVDPEARIDLERALAQLPVGRRTVLVLHDLYGHPHAEVAAALGISIGTSKSQLHDARVQLQSILKRERQT